MRFAAPATILTVLSLSTAAFAANPNDVVGQAQRFLGNNSDDQERAYERGRRDQERQSERQQYRQDYGYQNDRPPSDYRSGNYRGY